MNETLNHTEVATENKTAVFTDSLSNNPEMRAKLDTLARQGGESMVGWKASTFVAQETLNKPQDRVALLQDMSDFSRSLSMAARDKGQSESGDLKTVLDAMSQAYPELESLQLTGSLRELFRQEVINPQLPAEKLQEIEAKIVTAQETIRQYIEQQLAERNVKAEHTEMSKQIAHNVLQETQSLAVLENLALYLGRRVNAGSETGKASSENKFGRYLSFRNVLKNLVGRLNAPMVERHINQEVSRSS